MVEKEYFTIDEVSKEVKLPKHTLRFWESEIKQLSPLRTHSGQRKYTTEHIELIKKIKKLRYEDGYNLKAVKKILFNEKKRDPEQLHLELYKNIPIVEKIKKNVIPILKEIQEILHGGDIEI